MSQQHRLPPAFLSMNPEHRQQRQQYHQASALPGGAKATLGGGLPASLVTGLNAAATTPTLGLSSHSTPQIFPSNLSLGTNHSLIERIQAAQLPTGQANLLVAQLLAQQQQPMAGFDTSMASVQQPANDLNAANCSMIPAALAASLHQQQRQEQHLAVGGGNPYQEQLRQLHSVSRSLICARRQEEPYLPPALATTVTTLPSSQVQEITQPASSDAKVASTVTKALEKVAPSAAKQTPPERPLKFTGKIAVPDKPKRPLSAYNLFFRDERAKMIKVAAGKKKIGFSDMAKSISAKWKAIDDETSSMYQKLAAEEKEQYVEKMKVYNQKQQKLLEKSRQALEATVDEETRRKYFDAVV